MSKFMIETTHADSIQACEEIVRYFLNSGSHYLTNADWGCSAGEHKCWIIVEATSEDEALEIVPHQYRKDTRVIKLDQFNLETVDEVFGPYHN
jgi:hypothetical protein